MPRDIDRDDNGDMHGPRGPFIRRDGVDTNVFCFAERVHAEQFRARFGGEFINPKDRPKWPRPRR
jgi:hypothetical protein